MGKILLVGSIAGSIVNFRGDLIKAWIERGYQVVTLTRPSKEARKERIRALGAVHREIPIERDKINPWKDIKLILALRKIIREEKPEYIFAYTVKPVIYSSLAARLAGYRSRCFFMITGLGYAFSGQSLKQRFVKQVLRLFYRSALKRSEAVFFQNEDDLAVFKEQKLISDAQNVVMINGSGVNLEYFANNELPKGEDLTFLLIGRMLGSKGIREYARAARLVKENHKQVRFRLLGRLLNSPDSIRQEELDGWQKCEMVEYLGGTEDVRPYIKECSVYVLPSYREGTPRSVLEAMAMGRPVITTDAPGCRETIEEGVNGYLVPVKDSQALAEAMEEFIKNPMLISKMGAESRRIAEEKFDVHKVNRVILEAMGLNEKK